MNLDLSPTSSDKFRALLPLRSLGKKGPCVAETEIGEGNTCQWAALSVFAHFVEHSVLSHADDVCRVCAELFKVAGSLDRNTTIGFYFDIAQALTLAVR